MLQTINKPIQSKIDARYNSFLVYNPNEQREFRVCNDSWMGIQIPLNTQISICLNINMTLLTGSQHVLWHLRRSFRFSFLNDNSFPFNCIIVLYIFRISASSPAMSNLFKTDPKLSQSQQSGPPLIKKKSLKPSAILGITLHVFLCLSFWVLLLYLLLLSSFFGYDLHVVIDKV